MQKTHCLLIILLMHFFPLAQANEYTFKHITSANGLPQNYVRSVIQDSRGFMWFTTFDGIVGMMDILSKRIVGMITD